MSGGRLNGIVLWRIGLNDNLPPQSTTPCPAGNLTQQLKSPFPGTEIRQVQRRVSTNYPDQGNQWQIQSLGNHLRANQNVSLMGTQLT